MSVDPPSPRGRCTLVAPRQMVIRLNAHRNRLLLKDRGIVRRLARRRKEMMVLRLCQRPKRMVNIMMIDLAGPEEPMTVLTVRGLAPSGPSSGTLPLNSGLCLMHA